MSYLDLFRALEAEGVRYLAAGGVARILHGAEPMTMEIELMVDFEPANLARFVATARALALKPVSEDYGAAMRFRGPQIDNPSVDVVVHEALSFEEVYARRLLVELEDLTVSVLAPQDMVVLTGKPVRIETYDYSCELSDEQLRYYGAPPAIAKLRWLEEARRFALLARSARLANA